MQTSLEAKKSIEPHKERMKRIILEKIEMCPMTCDEVEVQTGFSHQSASARLTELKKERKIVPLSRRKTRSGRWAVVWGCTFQSQMELGIIL